MTKRTAMIVSIAYQDYLVTDEEAFINLLRAIPHMTKLGYTYEDSDVVYYKQGAPDFSAKTPKDGKVFESKEAFEVWKAAKDAAHEADRKEQAEAMAPTEDDTVERIDF